MEVGWKFHPNVRSLPSPFDKRPFCDILLKIQLSCTFISSCCFLCGVVESIGDDRWEDKTIDKQYRSEESQSFSRKETALRLAKSASHSAVAILAFCTHKNSRVNSTVNFGGL